MIVLKNIVSIARNDGSPPFNPFAAYINSPENVDKWYVTNVFAPQNYLLKSFPPKSEYHK